MKSYQEALSLVLEEADRRGGDLRHVLQYIVDQSNLPRVRTRYLVEKWLALPKEA